MELGNNERFLEYLKKASEFGVEYDILPAAATYTSPLINKLKIGQLVKNYKGNQAHNILKEFDGEKYNTIRESCKIFHFMTKKTIKMF